MNEFIYFEFYKQKKHAKPPSLRNIYRDVLVMCRA